MNSTRDQEPLYVTVTVDCTTATGKNLSHYSSSEAEVACILGIPNRLQLQWRSDPLDTKSYISRVNTAIRGNVVALKEGAMRLESRLRETCSKTHSKYMKATGRKRQAIKDATSTLFVLKGEIESTQTLKEEVTR